MTSGSCMLFPYCQYTQYAITITICRSLTRCVLYARWRFCIGHFDVVEYLRRKITTFYMILCLAHVNVSYRYRIFMVLVSCFLLARNSACWKCCYFDANITSSVWCLVPGSCPCIHTLEKSCKRAYLRMYHQLVDSLNLYSLPPLSLSFNDYRCRKCSSSKCIMMAETTTTTLT